MIQSTRHYTGYHSSGRSGGMTAAAVEKDMKYQQRREQQAKYWKKLKEAHCNGASDNEK